MRPPVCAICGKKFGDTGGLVTFKKTELDTAWDKRMEQPGMVGHPPYMEWFCEEHLQQARDLSHMTKPEAMGIIRKG